MGGGGRRWGSSSETGNVITEQENICVPRSATNHEQQLGNSRIFTTLLEQSSPEVRVQQAQPGGKEGTGQRSDRATRTAPALSSRVMTPSWAPPPGLASPDPNPNLPVLLLLWCFCDVSALSRLMFGYFLLFCSFISPIRFCFDGRWREQSPPHIFKVSEGRSSAHLFNFGPRASRHAAEC